MTEEIKIWSLRTGLSPSLKDEIMFRDEPTHLPDFITLLKKADIKMKSYHPDPANRHSHAPGPAPRPAPAPVTTASSFAPGRPVPIDLSAGGSQASQQERDAKM